VRGLREEVLGGLNSVRVKEGGSGGVENALVERRVCDDSFGVGWCRANIGDVEDLVVRALLRLFV
jgi:hypothetical protein